MPQDNGWNRIEADDHMIEWIDIQDADDYQAWLGGHFDEDDDEDRYDWEDDDLSDDDGQPSEYDEWQDYYGGDDWDHGQYDEC